MRNDRDKCDKDDCPAISEAMIDDIAERAAEKAVQKMTSTMYQEVGKGIVKRALWLTGVVVISLGYWLAERGHLKL